MASDIKSLKVRIKSINSTHQLTKAMELVASAKIRSATDAMNRSAEYLKAAFDIVKEISDEAEFKRSIYAKKAGGFKNVTIVIAGDRGLAGGYNSNIFKLVAFNEVGEIIPIGKLACEKYSGNILKTEKFDFVDAKKIAERLCKKFNEGKYNSVSIIYTKYISILTRVPEYEVVLPLETASDTIKSDIIYEPERSLVIDRIIEEYMAAKIFGAACEAFASEVSARRFAMESAGKNASMMLEELRLEYNRARQGAITQEITEIVAGSEL